MGPEIVRLFVYTHTGYKRITQGFMFKVVMHGFRIASSSRSSSTTMKYLMRVKKKAVYLGVKVFGDTIFTSPTGDGTAILQGWIGERESFFTCPNLDLQTHVRSLLGIKPNCLPSLVFS